MMKTKPVALSFAAGKDAVRSYAVLSLPDPAQQRAGGDGFGSMTVHSKLHS